MLMCSSIGKSMGGGGENTSENLSGCLFTLGI